VQRDGLKAAHDSVRLAKRRMMRYVRLVAIMGIVTGWFSVVAQAGELLKVEANRVVEVSLVSGKAYKNPFMEIELDAIVTQPSGKEGRQAVEIALCLKHYRRTCFSHGVLG